MSTLLNLTHIHQGKLFSLGLHGFIFHPVSSDAIYGRYKSTEGNVFSSTAPYNLAGESGVVGGNFVTSYDKTSNNTILLYNFKTGTIKRVKQYKPLLIGNQTAYKYIYDNATQHYRPGKMTVSWWHSQAGDGPIHEYRTNHPFYPPSSVPKYVPYVKDIDSSYYVDETDYFRVKLYYRDTDDEEYIIPPQLYVNGKLVYIHGDLEDPHGFFAGVHVVSSKRLLAVYVSGKNWITPYPPYTGDLLRYDLAELFDIDLTNKTVTSLGTVTQNDFFIDEVSVALGAQPRMTWPFRFNQTGTRVAGLQRMGDIYWPGLHASPFYNYINHIGGDGIFIEFTHLAVGVITQSSGPTFTLTTSLLESESYALNLNDDFLKVITEDTYEESIPDPPPPVTIPPTYVDGGWNKTIECQSSCQLDGTLSIPYAINYIDDVLTKATIEFDGAAYDVVYNNFEGVVTGKWWGTLSGPYFEYVSIDCTQHIRKQLPSYPILRMNGNDYLLNTEIEGYIDQYEDAVSNCIIPGDFDSLPAPNCTGTARTRQITPIKRFVSYVNIPCDVVVFSSRAFDSQADVYAQGSVTIVDGANVTYNSSGYVKSIKLDFMTINETLVFSNGNEDEIVAESEPYTQEYDTLYDWQNSSNYNDNIYDALFLPTIIDTHGETYYPENRYSNIWTRNYISNHIYSAVKIAVDLRSDGSKYIYVVKWPETTIIVDYTPEVTEEHFDERTAFGSNINSFASVIAELPGTSPSVDIVGLI